jgi:2-methylcitrate dehydratase PrpD
MGKESIEEPEAPGATEELCHWIHGLRIEDVPENIQNRAKYLLLDGLACAIVGAHLPWSEKAVNSMQAFEPSGQATIFSHSYVRPQTFLLIYHLLSSFLILNTPYTPTR